jgi:histidinol dehydrogenase
VIWVRTALAESIRRARRVHADQRRTEVTTQVVPGGTVTQRWLPVDRVGLYVPGGRAVYPSSVVMNTVPAQTAGVRSLAVASPPQKETGLPTSARARGEHDAALRVVDAYAAEHLEIQTRDARAVAERVRSAGAIFVGPWSPVSLGDYCAGSNHVLPTGGCARHSAGLSVQTFLRGVQLIEYGEDALHEVAPHVVALAEAEDLPAHGQAVSIRFGP